MRIENMCEQNFQKNRLETTIRRIVNVQRGDFTLDEIHRFLKLLDFSFR